MSSRRPNWISLTDLATRPWRRPGRSTGLRTRPTVVQLDDRITPAFAGGLSIAVGDVTGDAYPDIVASLANEGAPYVRIFDGSTGNLIREFLAYDRTFVGGVNVAMGDIDGDGIQEIITGTGEGGSPHVRVFDGRTGTERFGFYPYEDSFRGGVLVAAGDTNGDGLAEIITGTGVGGGPRVQVIDAATRVALQDFFAYEDSFRGGVLVGAGDVNGDGRSDIVTGTGVGGGPRVQVFDGMTLTSLSNFFAYEDSFRGGVVVSTGDVDGDGKAEVLTGTGPGGGPAITAFEGNTNQSQVRFLAFDPHYRGGIAIAGADLNGDGLAEVVGAASPNESPTIVVFTPDGSTILFTFSPFEPGGFPTRGFSTRVVPPYTNPSVILPPVGLTVNTTQVGAGLNERLTFTARVAANVPVTRVQLYQGDDQGRPVTPLVDLYDDGDFTHRDAVADDGMYSNALSVNLPTVGQHVYAAVVTTPTGTARYTVRVTAVDVPTEVRVASRIQQMTYQQSRLEQLLDSDVALPDALDIVRVELDRDPSIRSDSFQVSPVSVSWQTIEGIRLGVSATVGRGDVMTGGSPPDGAPGSKGTEPGDEGCGGSVLVLSPFEAEFNPRDPGQTIINDFREKGYSVTVETNTEVTIDDFENLGRYDVVVISSHGDEANDPNSMPMIMTGEPVRIGRAMERLHDLLTGRLTLMADYFAVTPGFFETYSGSLDGAVVYIGACRSARSNTLGNTFVRDLGAAAYAGFSEYVYTDFAADRADQMFEHLLAGGTVGTIPGAGLTETRDLPEPLNSATNNAHATFRVFTQDHSATLGPHCSRDQVYDLQITYSWANDQYDLDTGTQFLEGTAGYGYGGSEFLAFTGDITTAGGRETVMVDLSTSFALGRWDDQVQVVLHAGWFEPAGGTGPATITVALKNRETGELRDAVQVAIVPGRQTGPASERVGTITITDRSDSDDLDLAFTIDLDSDGPGFPVHDDRGYRS